MKLEPYISTVIVVVTVMLNLPTRRRHAVAVEQKCRPTLSSAES